MASDKAFRDEEGVLNAVAQRAHKRVLGDSVYLASWKKLGHSKAAEVACGQHGHLGIKGTCARCGAGPVELRAEHLNSR